MMRRRKEVESRCIKTQKTTGGGSMREVSERKLIKLEKKLLKSRRLLEYKNRRRCVKKWKKEMKEQKILM